MDYLNSAHIKTLFVFTYSLHTLDGIKVSTEYSNQPLYLTPYIEENKVEEGRQAALVTPFIEGDNTVSYSGYLTVKKKYNSNLFFWFFPNSKGNTNAPVILWLQGGPGRSSIYGLFEQNGPYYIDKNEHLLKREYDWSKISNIIYIDNPVGTGFSFTDHDEGYSRNETDIGRNLYSALQQFFQLFPEYKENDFYIAGSSYAGKFIPALAYTIDINQKVQSESNRINLKGLIIGNGYCDPVTIVQRSEILYQIGLIDSNFKLQLESYIDKTISLINQEKFLEALHFDENIMRQAVLNETGYRVTFNYLIDTPVYPFGDVRSYIQNNQTRYRLHVGNISFYTDPKVDIYLEGDIMQSVKPWIEYLLEKYRILMYNGQLDLIVSYPSIVKFLHSLKWSDANNYRNAKRILWYEDKKLAGYKKSVGKLTEVLVRNAGHNVGMDQPKYLFYLIQQFTSV